MRAVADVVFRPADPGGSAALGLIAAMVEELAVFYGRIDGPGTPSAQPSDFAPPGGVFLVGRPAIAPQPAAPVAAGRVLAGPAASAVAGGGVKRWDTTIGEIKRMYVAPEWRGRGVAVALLDALEAAAVELGYTTVRLDTGPRQPAAQAFYERHGYRRIADYNANPHASFWGEKSLSPGAGS